MDLFEQLLTTPSRGSVSPETLEYIGKKAASEYLEKRASLNQTIVNLASQHPELNNEHIHRIAEFANNVTFEQLFQQNKDKNVHFPIADPGVIIRDLRDGGSPAHDGKVLHNKGDYFRAPIREEKNADLNPAGTSDPESALDMFADRTDYSGQVGQGEPLQKVASVAGLDPSYEGSANPVNDVYAEHLKLQRAQTELSAQYESMDLLHKQAQADFYKSVKREVLAQDGVGLGPVTAAFQKIAGVKAAEQELIPIVDRLVQEGVSGDVLTAQLRKTAGKILNTNHPLVAAAAGLLKTAHDKEAARLALIDIEAGLEKTASFLKKAGSK